jgi:hypothetical protein
MVEQSAVNRWAVGSSPTSGARFSRENDGSYESRTDSAQIPAESEGKDVKFPKVIRHRKSEVTIYGRKKAYPFCRLAYRVNGQRRMQSFATYGEAKAEGKGALDVEIVDYH